MLRFGEGGRSGPPIRRRSWPVDNTRVFLRRIIGLGALVLALLAGSTTYALAASQELTPTGSPVSVAADGLSVLHVSYEVDPRNPTRIAAVRLRLATPSRGSVLTTFDGGATWVKCSARGSALRCPARGLRVQDAAGLSIAPARP
jgi:hypothetical protein